MRYQETMNMKGIWTFYITKGAPLTPEELTILRTGGSIGRPVQTIHYHNLIPTVCRQQIAKALSGGIATVTEIKITHQELGTSTQAPANSDTGLITPTGSTRKIVSSMAYSSNQLNLTSFWAAGEATGTWREFGLFINGTATSNSGTLFNRISINITVAAGNAMTIDGTVTIT